jgi:hypothetical protein
MNKRYFGFASIMTLCLLLLLISGCGSSGNKEGDTAAAPTVVSEASCVTCHSTSLEVLSGDQIVANYTTSAHNRNSVGCQDCHGAGGQHNGVGPIPYPRPNYVQCQGCHDSGTGTSYALVTAYSGSMHYNADFTAHVLNEPCNRCHTHQGAVYSVVSHFTGDGDVMEAEVNAPGAIAAAVAEPIKCDTCHVTHKTDQLRVDTAWDPSLTVGAVASSKTDPKNDQFRLCTQCHGYTTPTGELMGSGTATSGTALVGHHDTSWYRIIGTTHYDNPATSSSTSIEGYGMRFTLPDGSVNPNPCLDCHGHESKTNTNVNPSSASFETGATIYTDWANSGHARGLLTAKFAAVTANPVTGSRGSAENTTTGHAQTDAVMAAGVAGGAFAGHNTGSCGRCHATDGFSYYFENLTNNPGTPAAGVLKCYGCHTNPGAGTLRTMKGAKAATNYTTDLGWNPPGYTLNYGKKAYPDVAASNICISCHDSREKDPGAITDANNTNYMRTHYLQAATTMYVKMGFIAFTDEATLVPGSTTTTYRKSLMSDQDGGTITSTHRILGTPAMVGNHGITAADTKLLSRGPCVTCHFSGSHSQKIDQRAIDAVCSKCHTSEAGRSILAKADLDTYFLEPQSEAYQSALELAITIFNNKNTGISLNPEDVGSEFVRAYITGTTTEAAAAQWTAAMTVMGAGYDKTKVLGAVSNIVFLKRDPAAYAHARTYSRRLIYDTIDYLDDGIINSSVSATAIATLPAVYGKNATNAFTDSTLTTLAPGTTEAMVYLIGWSRSTGKWNANERP